MAARQACRDYSEVSHYYEGKSVFITGATGFMGKVLVERLLTACPGIEKIYLLLRQKRDVKPELRLQKLKESPVFERLRHTEPSQLNKLVALWGDITEDNLGLTPDAIEMLHRVSVVFHTAATVKFDEQLKLAVKLNILAPIKLMKICKGLPGIEAFIHVSTCYGNCDKREIEEIVYQSSCDLDSLLAACECLPQDMLQTLTDKFIGEKPNTYTFTKALCENAVLKQAGSYPVAIFRPSIVTAALQKPFPGWIDSLNGPTGLIVGAGKGLLRSMYCKRDCVADLVPVDIAIDAMICVGYFTAIDRSPEVKVYNCCTGASNPITWYQIEDTMKGYLRSYPLDGAIWYPGGSFKNNRYLDWLCKILFQTVPAYLLDYSIWALGVKAPMSFITINKKMNQAMSALNFFAINEWKFKDDNFKAIHTRLSAADRAIFNTDPSTIEWQQYMKNYVKGTRKYVLREKEQDIAKARKHIRRLCVLHYALQTIFLLVFLRVLIQRSETVRTVLHGTIKLLLSLFGSAYHRISATS